MMYDLYMFDHGVLHIHFWTLPAIIIALVMVIMVLVHNHKQKKREKEFELAGKFRISSIPTLLVLRDGKVVNQAMGARPKQAILDLL